MPERIAAVREFNRFYTRRIGVLHEGLLDSPWSLAEVRVLYELAHRAGVTARDLARDLGPRRRLPEPHPAALRAAGPRAPRHRGRRRAPAPALAHRRGPARIRAARPPLREGGGRHARAAIGEADQVRLTGCDAGDRAHPRAGGSASPFVLRTHRPGDMGWVVQAHGEIYFREYGWDERFEALVAHIAAEFIDKFEPSGERCWIAERDGERVGSVFLVRKSATVAKLRLLIVDPKARGTGLGKQLVGRMHPLRARVRLPQDHAVDAAEPHRGAAHLPGGRLQARGAREPRDVRRAAGRRDVGARAVGPGPSPSVR